MSAVFISHSSRDQKVARILCAALESRGHRCWLAGRDISAGENFQEAIVTAIRSAGVMVLVFTESANNSTEIKKELALASQHDLPVIPVRLEDVVPAAAFAYELATRQWINLFEDWEHELKNLCERVRQLVDAPHEAGTPQLRLRPQGRSSPSAQPTTSVAEFLAAAQSMSPSPSGASAAQQRSPGLPWPLALGLIVAALLQLGLGLWLFLVVLYKGPTTEFNWLAADVLITGIVSVIAGGLLGSTATRVRRAGVFLGSLAALRNLGWLVFWALLYFGLVSSRADRIAYIFHALPTLTCLILLVVAFTHRPGAGHTEVVQARSVPLWLGITLTLLGVARLVGVGLNLVREVAPRALRLHDPSDWLFLATLVIPAAATVLAGLLVSARTRGRAKAGATLCVLVAVHDLGWLGSLLLFLMVHNKQIVSNLMVWQFIVPMIPCLVAIVAILACRTARVRPAIG